jgi:hypothetical protein
MGMVFPIAIVLGWRRGRGAGGLLGRRAAGGLIGLALGALAGFWELFKVAKRLEGYDGQKGAGQSGGAGGDGGGKGDRGSGGDGNGNSNGP